MDNVERLMASRPEIKIKLMRMPKGMPGYIKGNRIYLEKKDNSREQYEVLLEERVCQESCVNSSLYD